MSRSLTVKRVGIIRSSVSRGQILEEKFIVLHRSGKKKRKKKEDTLKWHFSSHSALCGGKQTQTTLNIYIYKYFCPDWSAHPGQCTLLW